MLNIQKINDKNNVFFLLKNNFIFRFDEYIIDYYVFELRKFCIFQLFITKTFDIIYNAKNNHANF